MSKYTFERTEREFEINGKQVIVYNEHTIFDNQWHIEIDGVKSVFCSKTLRGAKDVAEKLANGASTMEIMFA